MVIVTKEKNGGGATNTIEALAMSAQGQELLTSLVGFIQPIIRIYSSVSADSAMTDEVRLQSDVQDRELLAALKSFVKSTVSAHSEFQGESESEHTEVPGGEPHPEILTMAKAPYTAFPGDIEAHGINMIMTSLRQRVFNTLPIRMLAFNSYGSEIRLVNRNEIINLVFTKVCAEATYCGRFIASKHRVDELVETHSAYAILSHTWIRDTPGDVVFGEWNNRALNPRGCSKITNFCEAAARNHCMTFGWMDTVCINKESSSELDESIRSMYKWYQKAEVCVAYMSETETLESMHTDSWFTRGWTLQELLAPNNIQFYDKSWGFIQLEFADTPFPFHPVATPDDVQRQIQEATTITFTEIGNCRRGRPDLIPISRKFQLAAQRVVTRAEDLVYSLMGLMDVDMSVAYGEGAKRALYRLQREILTTKRNPLDIFNCAIVGSNILPFHLNAYKHRTRHFDILHDNRIASALELWTPNEPLLCTHLGIQLQVLLIPGIIRYSTDVNTIWTPKGNFYGEAKYSNTIRYLLLHEDMYNGRLPPPSSIGYYPQVLHFGIINVTAKNNYITLPNTCLAVPLDCGATPPGTVTQWDIVGIDHIGRALTFCLNSITNEDGLAMKTLESNGMQLITLYL